MKKISVSEKISQVLEAKRVAPSKAEQMCGFGVGTISKLIDRDGKFHSSNEEKFLRTFSVNEEWWRDSHGEMFRTPAQVESGASGAENSQFLDRISTGDYIGMHNKAWYQVEETMKLQRQLLRESSVNTKNLITQLKKLVDEIASIKGEVRK